MNDYDWISGGIVEELRDNRFAGEPWDTLLADAATEIERLRVLITAWIDEKDAMRQAPPSDLSHDLAAAEAEDALRKAVGR